MAKFRSIRNSFLGGQISPTATARTDLPQYPHSCELLQNMIPMLSGGAYRRPGTFYMQDFGSDTNNPPRLLPFIVSKFEAYCLAILTDMATQVTTVRAYRPTSNSSKTISNATGTLPYRRTTLTEYAADRGAVDPNATTDDDVTTLQHVQSADIMWLVHPRFKPQTIKRTNFDTFVCSDWATDSTGTALTGLALVNSRPYLDQNASTITLAPAATTGNTTLTASAPYFTADMVDTIFRIDHGTGVVGAAIVTGYTSTTVVNVTVLVAFSATTAKVNWWESAWSTHRGWPRAIAIFQERLVMAGTNHQPDSIWFSATGNYQTFSVLGTVGVAGAVLVNGVTLTAPVKTATNNVIIFPTDASEGDGVSTGPTGSQPFRITLAQTQVDLIQWLSPDKELLVGTKAQEWIISPQSGDFSVANSPTVLQSKYGSDYIQPQRIGYELIFALPQGDEVRAYQYNYIDASFFAEPVQLLFDSYPQPEGNFSITPGRRKIRHMEWDVSRQTLWVCDTAGSFYGMTRDRKLSTTMWHTHILGGSTDSTTIDNASLFGDPFSDAAWYANNGGVVSFTVVPNAFSGGSDIWVATKRAVQNQPGDIRWCIERMIGKGVRKSSAFSAAAAITALDESPLVDSAIFFFDPSLPTTKQFTDPAGDAGVPLGHLDGFSLTGTYYSPNTGMNKLLTNQVAAQIFTIQDPVPADYGSASSNTIILGLPFKSIIRPVRLEAGSVIGTAQAALKRVNRVFIRFFNSMVAKVGMAPGGEQSGILEEVIFKDPTSPMGESAEFFTGDKKVLIPSQYDRDGYLSIETDEPLPMTVLGIISEGEEFD